MIVNYKEKGWEVITQRSHGILAAQVAANWRVSDRPVRWMETLLAIAEHDDAENELDGEILLTPGGGPLNFDMKNFELPHCEKLFTLAVTKSRYIALLTSMHTIFLYEKEAVTNAAAKAFLKEQRKLQATWRNELGITTPEAQRVYDLLEWCDALSLLICQGQMQPEKRKMEISTGPDKKMYHLAQLAGDSLTVEPWPFAVSNFMVSFESRLIPQIQFASSAEFRELFLATRPIEKTWKLVRPKKPVTPKKNKV